jgi:hypothetical protein
MKFSGRLNTLSDVYIAILFPVAVGRPEAHVLFQEPSNEYRVNKGLDANKDGSITKAEAAAKVFQRLTKGLKNDLRG